MTTKSKSYLFFGFFSACFLLFFLLPNFSVCNEFIRSFDIFTHEHSNFIFIMVLFLSVSYLLTELTAYAWRLVARMKWQTPRIGRILVAQGYISQDDLYLALREQSYKIGQVLLQEGRIKPQQLAHALAIQKKDRRKLGRLLTELGYSSEADVQWALSRPKRRLGRILREKSLISDYDLACALALKKYRMDPQGRIFIKE